MEPKVANKFCPRCGGKLIPQEEDLLICSKCEYRFYINVVVTNGAIIENEKGEIMLTKRKFEPKKGFWDIPGGFVKPNEKLEDSMKRELKEELGIEVKVEKLIGVYPETYLYQNVIGYIAAIFLKATIIKGKITPSDDVSEYKYFSPKEILGMDLAFESIKLAIADYIKG